MDEQTTNPTQRLPTGDATGDIATLISDQAASHDELGQVFANNIVGLYTQPAEQFIANPLNWRVHPRNQREAVKASLERLGWVSVVIVNQRTGHLIDGHERLWQVLGRNPEAEVPYLLIDISEEDERLALAILDPITAMATADADILVDLLDQIDVTGGALGDLLAVLGNQVGVEPVSDVDIGRDTEPQVGRASELQAKWGTEEGQIWQLGDHLLACGDCRDGLLLARLWGGDQAHLLFTSPPYWVGKEYETQRSEAEIDAFITECAAAWQPCLRPDYGRLVINTGTAAIHRIETGRRVEVLPLVFKWQLALRAHGWLARYYRVWAKSGGFFQLGGRSIAPKTDTVDQHWENIVEFVPEGEGPVAQYLGAFWAPDGEQRGQEKVGLSWANQGIWLDVPRVKGGVDHPAAFPVEIAARNVLLYTKRGESVFEPFAGSGTTFLACENLSRRCRGVELDPRYVAVALERYQDHCGIEPQLWTEGPLASKGPQDGEGGTEEP